MTKSRPIPDTDPTDQGPETQPPPTEEPAPEQPPEVPPNAMHDPAHLLHHLRNT